MPQGPTTCLRASLVGAPPPVPGRKALARCGTGTTDSEGGRLWRQTRQTRQTPLHHRHRAQAPRCGCAGAHTAGRWRVRCHGARSGGRCGSRRQPTGRQGRAGSVPHHTHRRAPGRLLSTCGSTSDAAMAAVDELANGGAATSSMPPYCDRIVVAMSAGGAVGVGGLAAQAARQSMRPGHRRSQFPRRACARGHSARLGGTRAARAVGGLSGCLASVTH